MPKEKNPIPKPVSNKQARFIAAYSVGVIETLISILEKSGIVGEDKIATDVAVYLGHHSDIINQLIDGRKPENIFKDKNYINTKPIKPVKL